MLARAFAAETGAPPDAYFDLLDSELTRRYTTSPHSFYHDVKYLLGSVPSAGSPLLVVIDEVQKLPALLDEVHALIEAHKGSVQFLLTGSSARKLKRAEVNLLAGRAISLHLHPLSSLETDLNLERALQFGTLPSIYLDSGDVTPVLRAYVDTYLKEEIRQEAIVRNVDGFTRFLEIAGQNNGEPINFSRIARIVKVSDKTIREYFEILCDTLIATSVPIWSYSVRTQLAQAPKYYLFDTGVLNVILGEIRTELRSNTYRYGRLFESLIVNEIRRSVDYRDTGHRLFHWRTSRGDEVDLILSRGAGDTPLAIEVKSGESPTEKELTGLLKFKEEHPEATLFCFCRTPRAYQIGPIEVLPWRQGIVERIQ